MGLRFTSSRAADEPGASADVPWQDAIDGGTTPDGGLWVPVDLPPTFDEPPEPGTLGPFADWATPRAMEWLDGTSTPSPTLQALRDALDVPVRLRALGPDIDLLDLSGGPTGAFKDVGARFLATLWAAAPRADGGVRTVLTATSGDTGGAVAAAIEGLSGLRGLVVFPLGRVSEVQRRQFTTRAGAVRSVAVRGTFDDCQAMVRAAFADRDLVEAHGLVSANSINPGRLMPQALYYGWLGAIAPDRPVVVPSGNLGNVTAAVMARQMGARLGAIHAAVNENDALVRAARGEAAPPGPAVRTDSSAMDVVIPSNLERLQWLARRTADRVGDGVAHVVRASSIGGEPSRAAQRWSHAEHGIVVDPHTAVGVARARDLLEAEPGCSPVVVETAHPAKFPEVVRAVLGIDPPEAAHLARPGAERWTVVDPDVGALIGALTEVAIR